MSKQFTVITKDGSKWLRPVNPYEKHLVDEFGLFRNPDHVTFGLNNPDIPYIGSHPEGMTLEESEVRAVRQWKHHLSCIWNNDTNTSWRDDHPEYETRTVYTDAESHDRHIIESEYWKMRALSAEKLIEMEPSDPKTYDEFCRLRDEWRELKNQEPPPY